ncbi:MAG: type II toxin-antitoxin system RelE/ParE family toxin [Candidatus Sulfotelmatobacter sp.]
MPNKVVEFHEEAAADYDAAFDWYLRRSPDAALRFSAAVESALGQILQAPDRWAESDFHTRRFLLRHFPYILVYREKPSGNLQILAVAHTGRKPRYWKGRV